MGRDRSSGRHARRRIAGFPRLCVAALAGLALFLAPRDAMADWLSLQSDHFQVIGNTTAGELRTVALRLEQFREAVGQLDPAVLREGAAPPVVVLVFRDSKSYEPFMPRANGRVVPVAGYFQGGQDVNYITLTLENREQAFPVIYHEFSHLLLRGVFADAPLWFSEGLAEYYSTFEVIGNGRRANIGRPIARHVQLLRSRRLPFGRFFAIEHNSPEYTIDSMDRDVLYAQAWAIVHHAFHGESKRRDQLLAFVTKVAAGGSTENSFRDAYGIGVPDLEREVQRYVQNPAYQYSIMEFPDSILTRVKTQTTPIADAEADAWLGDLLVHMNRNEEGVRLLEKALAAKPDSALAHASLGRLQMRQDRAAEGMAHLRQAMAAGTVNEYTYYSYAYGLITQGDRNNDTWQQAAGALERAIQLRPGYTEAKLLLASTYMSTEKYAMARDLMEALVRAEPTNHRAALQLGDALLRLDDLEGAQRILGQVLARSTNRADQDRARTLLGYMARLKTQRDSATGRPAPGPPPATSSTPVTGTPATSTPATTTSAPRPTLGPAFRRVSPGEQRAYGVFETVECGPNGIVLLVRTATGVLRARAASFSAIEFIAYRKLASTAIACGPQKPPMEIYLTWRPQSDAASDAESRAVAVEVLPEAFVPPR